MVTYRLRPTRHHWPNVKQTNTNKQNRLLLVVRINYPYTTIIIVIDKETSTQRYTRLQHNFYRGVNIPTNYSLEVCDPQPATMLRARGSWLDVRMSDDMGFLKYSFQYLPLYTMRYWYRKCTYILVALLSIHALT